MSIPRCCCRLHGIRRTKPAPETHFGGHCQSRIAQRTWTSQLHVVCDLLPRISIPFIYFIASVASERLTSWLCQCASVCKGQVPKTITYASLLLTMSAQSLRTSYAFSYETTWFTTFQCHSSPKTVSEMPYAICNLLVQLAVF